MRERERERERRERRETGATVGVEVDFRGNPNPTCLTALSFVLLLPKNRRAEWKNDYGKGRNKGEAKSSGVPDARTLVQDGKRPP